MEYNTILELRNLDREHDMYNDLVGMSIGLSVFRQGRRPVRALGDAGHILTCS